MHDRWRSNTCRLSTCLSLVFIFFLAELVVGHVCDSLALQADAFHMLSDSVSILLSLIAVRMEKKPADSRNTFGWQRASVVGPLVNSVMLQTFCFTIFQHAVERFVSPEKVKDPVLMFSVGVGGLLVNVVSLFILHGTHAHSHGDPMSTHSHGGGTEENEEDELEVEPLANGDNQIASSYGHGHSSPKGVKHDSIFAVQLHVFADLIGSIVVIVSALILWLVPDSYSSSTSGSTTSLSPLSSFSTLSLPSLFNSTTAPLPISAFPAVPALEEVTSWKDYIDPLLSLVLVAIVSWKNIPFLKRLAEVLMQSVPQSVEVRQLEAEILKVPEVQAVHDLHVWQLHKSCCIGTVHVICNLSDDEALHKIISQVKYLFHEVNVHCTTIQVESIQHGVIRSDDLTDENQNSCREPCPSGECVWDQCCNKTRDLHILTTVTSPAEQVTSAATGELHQRV